MIGVSAPSEALATAALSFGFVRASYLARSGTATLHPIAPESLETGAWVWFRAGATVRTGRFLGFDLAGNIRTSNGHFRRASVTEVRLLPGWLQGREGTADYHDGVDQLFLKQMLRSTDPLAFATSWSTRLLVIGSVSRMNQELDLRIAPAAPDATMGTIRQIVRPLDRDAPLGCQSVLVSAQLEEPPWLAWETPPALTILRGAYATSRWLPEITSGCVISVLGRAEPGLEAAVAALMQARSYAEPLGSTALGWVAPTSCEVLAFDEAA
ncbi:hypothetical protein [Ornithinimicrobium avium]|uniref:hypothetical protein n=1 Tax=Ornithinimicrobium avium TaxID=2283195 RepID=UPI0013B38CC1|nr:hypothetical protein [Ornithinimicrobium avium]